MSTAKGGKEAEGRRLWKKAWGFNLFPMFISPPGDKPCAIKKHQPLPPVGRTAAPRKTIEGQNEKDKKMCRHLSKNRRGPIYMRVFALESHIHEDIPQTHRVRNSVWCTLHTCGIKSPSQRQTYLNKKKANIFGLSCHGESFSSGNENASLELSSY